MVYFDSYKSEHKKAKKYIEQIILILKHIIIMICIKAMIHD